MTSEPSSHKAKFHPLSPEEITQLTKQGCSCNDWSNVQVADGFNPGPINSTHFSGEVKLGVFEKKMVFFGGITKPTGISNATIHKCRIGDNVYINNIRNHIANYIIEDDVLIENVDLLAVEGASCFGNGTEAAVVNEAGGREVPIYDHLSAQVAYVMAFYRHRPKVIKAIKKMIADYTGSVRSTMGFIGKAAKLTNCRIIKNVKVGPASVIEGADRLENGSVNSCPEDPVHIGSGVIAEDFICCSGSKVIDRVIISKCLVGQGVILAKQFSAENSVFFANCECFGGEACSIFAGPYTVTHHKSTLLIAGLYSFFNAGSGTNQSNHMYKLGPVHQGVVERGCKTTSDSYILWPAKVGALTVVAGRHYNRPDTSEFPFSYLLEQNGESILTPGTNLRKIGVFRDIKKWPERNRRKSQKILDLINFELLSPYTIQKTIKAHKLLSNHKSKANRKDYLNCAGVRIRSITIESGIKFYQMALDKFLGDCLVKRLENKQFKNVSEFQALLKPDSDLGTGRWVDLAGLLTPEKTVQNMLDDIEKGTINTLEQLTDTFQSMHNNYPAYEWAYASDLLQQFYDKSVEALTADDVIEIITNWKVAIEKLGRLLIADAQNEFSDVAKIGYGLDGQEQTKDADFEAVRGRFEQNNIVREIEEYITTKTKLANELIDRREKLH